MGALLLIGGAALALFAFASKAYAFNTPVSGQTGGTPAGSPSFSITRGSGTSGTQQGGIDSRSLASSSTGIGLAVAGNFAHTGSALASAVPVVGAIAAVGFGIWGAISENHKRAVALEANTLNEVIPIIREQFLLIVKGLGTREVNPTQSKQELDKIVAAYYQAVSKIIKGRWTYSGPLDYVGSGGTGKQPSLCNGPCVVGHYWVEGDAFAIQLHAPHIYGGAHGEFNLDTIPPHAGFNGYPSATIRY